MKKLIFLVILAGFAAAALSQVTTVPSLSGASPSLDGPWLNKVFYVRDWTQGNWPGLPDSADNELTNGGFEGTNLHPWFTQGGTTGTITRVFDQTGALEGDHILRFENDTGEYCGLKQVVDLAAAGLLPGTRVVCSTALRLSTGFFSTAWTGGKAKIEINWKKIDGTPIHLDSVPAEATLNEWTMLSRLFTVPAEAATAEIRLSLDDIPHFESTCAATPYRAEFDAVSFYREPDREFLTRIGQDQWTGPRGLLLTMTGIEPIEDGFRIRGSLENSGTDRVVVDLGYAPSIRLPVSGRRPVWHNGFTDAVEAHAGLHLLAEPVDPVANWPVHSGYPFSALSVRSIVHSLAVPLDEPRVAHTAFDADEGIHLIEFHLGLLGSGEPGYEDYTFAADKVRLKSDWGFRAAAKSYLSRYGHLIEPDPIAIGGALCDPADPDWGPYLEEMGMRYFQTMSGAEVDAYGGDFIPLLYSCPWTLRFSYGDPPIALDFTTIMSSYDTWMATTFTTPGKLEDEVMHGMDNSIMGSFGGSRLLSGNADTRHRNYQLPMNLNPALPVPPGSTWQHNVATGYMAYVDDMYAGPQVHAYAGVEADLYMNGNRHMDYTDENLQCPNPYGLTYAIGALTPAAWGGLSDLAYAAAMNDHVAGTTGPLTAGNLQLRGLGHQAFAAPFLDAGGFECSAFRYDDYCGTPEEQYSRRFIMNHRPLSRIYCPFKADYGPYVPDGDEERIFDELSAMAAFYGFYPSLTKFYDAFPSYITSQEYPVLAGIVGGYVPIVDALYAAAWEPVTRAQTSHEDVWIERYGPEGGTVYFTLLNNPHHTTLNEESFPTWPTGPEFQAHDRDITVGVESLFDLGVTGNLVIREEVTGDCFYPGFSNGLSAFAAQGDWDGLTITRHDGASFLMPARALRTFAISGSLEVDNDRVKVSYPADDTPYFEFAGSSWQEWFDGSANEGDALFTATSLNAPTATFTWSVIEPGTRDVFVVWPDIEMSRTVARYQVFLNGVPLGLPTDLDQNINTGQWQKVATVTTTAAWPACDTIELVVSYAAPGSLKPLVVDAARLE